MEQPALKQSVRQTTWKGGLILAFGLLLIGWLFNTPPGFLGKADAVGYAVCHRIDVRSFHIGERAMPLCARCTGMYLGTILAFGFQWVHGIYRSGLPPRKLWVIFALLIAAFGVDGVNSYFQLEMMQKMLPQIPRLYQANNIVRLFTGTGMGITIAAALLPVFNQTVWERLDPRPALDGWRSLGILLALGIGIDLLVLSDIHEILYPLAWISSQGVPVILTLVYAMVWIMALRRENRYRGPFDLAFPLLGGLFIALAQLAVLDWLRYQLTGTWGGFPVQ
jgi:uncharacterized membrane protein